MYLPVVLSPVSRVTLNLSKLQIGFTHVLGIEDYGFHHLPLHKYCAEDDLRRKDRLATDKSRVVQWKLSHLPGNALSRGLPIYHVPKVCLMSYDP